MTTTEPLQTRPRLRYACDELTSLAKQLGPHAQLPTMVQLRESLGVSMNTLNAALRELEKQHILRSVHGVGIFVRESRKRALTGNIGIIGNRNFKSLSSSSKISVLHEDLRSPYHSPFYARILDGVQIAALEHQRRLILAGTDHHWTSDSLEMVDGLILSDHSDATNQKIRAAAPEGMPCVSIFTVSEGMSCVVSDDYKGAKLAVQHLMELGHRRIACLMAEDSLTFRGRFAGYCDALQKAGVAADSRWMRLAQTPQAAAYREWAHQQMGIWLRDGWKKLHCTALLVQNDQAAIGAMQLMQEEGIAIPGEVSVIGFDGTELCDYASPRLSSVRLPLERMGREAVNLLVKQIDNDLAEPQTITLSTRWRDGASVGPPKSTFS